MTIPERVPVSVSIAGRLAVRYEYNENGSTRDKFRDSVNACRISMEFMQNFTRRLMLYRGSGGSELQRALILSLGGATSQVRYDMNLVSRLAATLPAIENGQYSHKTALMEILALKSIFPDVYYEPATTNLVVITRPIRLVHEGMGQIIGPLAITLEKPEPNKCRLPSIYVMKTEHTVCSHDGYVHPHVQSGRMCQGEARVPILKALCEGRILDVFMIADKTLRSYAPGDNYRTLEYWDSPPPTTRECNNSDCETTYDFEDEGGDCERCDGQFCDDCFNRCPLCEQSLCDECAGWVCVGNQTVCHRCVEECSCCDTIEAEGIMNHCEESSQPICVKCECHTKYGQVFGPDCVLKCKSCGEFFYYADIENDLCQECSDANTEGE